MLNSILSRLVLSMGRSIKDRYFNEEMKNTAHEIIASVDEAMNLAGNVEQARNQIEIVKERARFLNDPDTLAYCHLMSGRHYILTGYCSDAKPELRYARKMYQKLRDPAGLGTALNMLGITEEESGRLRAALSLYKESIPYAVKAGDLLQQAYGCENAGNVSEQMRHYDEAEELFFKAAACYREAGEEICEAGVLNRLAWIKYSKSDLQSCSECHSKALEIYTSHHNVEGICESAADLCKIELYRGNIDSALELSSILSDAIEETENIDAAAYSLNAIALVAISLGKMDEAQSFLDRALSGFGDDLSNINRICSLQLLTRVKILTGRPDDARAHVTEAERSLKDDDSNELKGINLLCKADVLRLYGKPGHSLQYYRNALNVLSRCGSPVSAIDCRIGMGNALIASGRTGEAKKCVEKALRDTGEISYSLGRALALETLGIIEYFTGNYRIAEDLLEQALQLHEGLNSPISVAESLYYLGEVQHQIGEIARAQRCFDQAIELFDELGYIQGRVLCLLSISVLYNTLDKMEKVEQIADEVMKIAEQMDNCLYKATALNIRADLLLQKGLENEALGYYREALKLFAESGSAIGASCALQNIQSLTVHQAHMKQAEKLICRNLAASRKMKDTDGQINCLIDLARLSWTSRKFGDAERIFNDALRLAEKEECIWSIIRIRYLLSLLLMEQGKYEKAAPHIERAVDAAERVRINSGHHDMKIGIQRAFSDEYEAAVEISLALDDERSAFMYAERLHGRALRDIMAERSRRAVWNLSAEERARLNELREEAVCAMCETMQLPECEGSRDEAWEESADRRRSAQCSMQEFEQSLFHRYEPLEVTDNGKPQTLEDAVSYIGDDAALLEYVVGKEETHLFCVSRSDADGSDYEVTCCPLGSGYKEIEALVLSMRRYCLDEWTPEMFKKHVPPIYDQLLAPALVNLDRDRVRKLIIIPDGPLFSMPFQALMHRDSSTGSYRFLIDSFEISYGISSSVIHALNEKKIRKADNVQNDLLICAYESSLKSAGNANLSPLPAVRREVDSIARHYSGSRILEEAGSSAETIISAMKGSGKVHFASHVIIDEENPLFSAVILAGESPYENRFECLFARDFMDSSADLSHCELVTLSCCDSASGKVLPGEGILGFPWVLHASGVGGVLVTQWPVYDEAAADLTALFYENLKKGETAQAALRRAMQEIRKRAGCSAPGIWAPFVYFGATSKR